MNGLFDSIQLAVSSLRLEASGYHQGTRIWMAVMAITLGLSIVFLFSKPNARWLFVVFIVNVAGLIIGKMLFPDFSRTAIGTAIHLCFWPLVLIAIWHPRMGGQRAQFSGSAWDRVYTAWIMWASVVMVISLFFDARTAIGWAFHGGL